MTRTSAFPDVVTAMSDPRLFGPMFAGSSWDNWRTVLRGAFGLAMSPAETEFFRTVAGREPPGSRVKELDIVAGRRSGKDSVASAVACYAAVTFQPDGKVRPGERPLVMLLGADRAQARSLLSYVKGYFAEIAPLQALVERETLDGLELRTGVDIVVQTSDFRSARGRTVLLAVFNETAFWPSETSSSPGTEVFRAVQPAMASLSDEAMLIMISSAYKRDGLLYDRWKRYFGTNDQNTLVIHARTPDLNPSIPQSIIDAALADDPQAAEAEWNSRWRDDLASYLTRAEIEAVVDRGITVRPPRGGVQYLAWVDASSGSGTDSMCCAIGHREGDDRFIVDAVVEIKPPFSPQDACSTIAQTLRSYNITRCTGDRWGLNFVAAEFARHGITLEYASKNSSEIFREALPIIRSRRCRLPDNERMVGQFCNLERRALSGGAERIGHPERSGHHDDLCLVVAGCLVALSTPLSGAEGWCRLYEAWSQGRRYGGETYATDVDPIRPPAFGYSFEAAQFVTLIVPAPFDAEGGLNLDGGWHGFRRSGDRTTLDVSRKAAAQLLKHFAWRAANPDLKIEEDEAA